MLLPDHLHALWSLPPGDVDDSRCWGWIKKEFTKRWLDTGAVETLVSKAREHERRRGVWQPRFGEHTLEDEDDFERHFDDIHDNPVKHGSVRCPYEWPWSSFHRWVRARVYPQHGACWSDGQKLDFSKIAKTVGE